MKKRSFEEVRNQINKISEALFGVGDDISSEEAGEILTEAGFELDDLNNGLYAHLYKEAQQFWMAGKPLPELLKRALDDLRPASASPRNEKELANQAKSRIEQIVEQTKLLASTLGRELEFAESYRNKGNLSKEERQTLDQMKKDLTARIKRERKDEPNG